MPSSVIKPSGSFFRVGAQRRAIEGALDAVARDIQEDFDRTTATWEHDVAFPIAKAGEFVRTIGTTDAIYAMLDAGTPEHLIFPRNGKFLKFQTPFRAKTVPQSIMSGPGSVGSQTVYSRGVIHPGTKARAWAATIADTWRDVWPGRLQQAIDGSLA